MKKSLLIGTIAISTLCLQNTASALTGSANIEINGNDNVKVGETFEITVDIKNTTNSIVSFEGNLDFDNNIIELVNVETAKEPYEFYINEDYNYKLAGIDLTLNNGILNDTKIYTFTFKAKKDGSTNITLKNYKLTDTNDYINTVVKSKKINIEKEEIVEEKEETKVQEKYVEKTEIKNEIVELKTQEVKKEKNIFQNRFGLVTNLLKKIILLFR